MKFPLPSNRRTTIIVVVTVVLLFAAGCATRVPAPVVERTPMQPLPPPATAVAPVPPVEPVVPTYTVKRGDTLRNIAQDKGVDTRALAAWNNIDNPNRLSVGQVLRLGPPSAAASDMPVPGPTDVSGSGVTTAPLRFSPPVTETGSAAAATAGAPLPGPRTTDNFKSSPKVVKEPYSAEALQNFGKRAVAPAAVPPAVASPPATARADEPAAPPARAASPPMGGDDDHMDWMWPVKGKIVGAYSETANLKGIDIAGTAGTPIVASAAGKVVYADSGLRGYGKLVVIKHNETYLSAYAHNSKIVVKEGEVVKRGQKIAEMGSTDADSVKLHFEIRRLGKPMDPTRFLPPS